LTVEAWVNVSTSDATHARLFDFGDTDTNTGAGAYGLDFSPKAGAGSWFEVFNTDPGTSSAQQLLGTSLAGEGLMQVVTVYDPQSGSATVYTNGVLEASGALNIPFSSLSDTHDFIGKSGYTNDPCLSASVREFRVYSGDMTASQVTADYGAGPATLVTNAGALLNLSLAIPSVVYLGQTFQAAVTAGYQNSPNVSLAPAALILQSGNSAIIKPGQNSTLTAAGAGTTTVTAAYGGLTATASVTVMPALAHRYEFNEPANSLTFTDLVGGANGTVEGAAHLDGAGHLVLPGGASPNNNNYGLLPANLITGYAAVTFEFWVAFGANPAWGRLVDFGYTDSTGNGADCIDFTSHSGNSPNGVNFEVSDSDPGFNDAQVVAPPTVLDNQGEMQLVLVCNPLGQSLLVYTNGVLMGQNTNLTIPLSALNNAHSYLGKSSYSSDPNGVATVDEFRIYNGVLSPAQVATDYATGPGALPRPTLSVFLSGNNVVLAWPASSLGYQLQTAATLNAGVSWGPAPGAPDPVLANGFYQVAVPVSQQAAFYRLVE
jgi:hypothetical protein